MELTINIPSPSKLIDTVKAKLARSTPKDSPKVPYGCYKDRDTGIWFSYWFLEGKCYVVPTPQGINSKDYAKQYQHTVPTLDQNTVSYEANCDRCHTTGHIYGGKCYTCDGKGWLSPIDRFRAANRAAREHTSNS